MYSCETVGKGASITRMGAVRNYSTNTIMEKKKNKEERAGLKIWNFQWCWRSSKLIFQVVN